MFRPTGGRDCVDNQKVYVVAVCDVHDATKPDFRYSRSKPPTNFKLRMVQDIIALVRKGLMAKMLRRARCPD